MYNLANVLSPQGKYDQMEEMHRRALRRRWANSILQQLKNMDEWTAIEPGFLITNVQIGPSESFIPT
jgi:hypothetical protein